MKLAPTGQRKPKEDRKKVSLDGAATRTSSRESLTVPRALCNKNRQLERPSCAVKPAWSDARIQLDPTPSACAGERSKTACSCTDAGGLICGEPRTVIPWIGIEQFPSRLAITARVLFGYRPLGHQRPNEKKGSALCSMDPKVRDSGSGVRT